MRKPFVRKSADERRFEIIKEAYDILISKGYSELSLRGVSKKTGVSLSTVQYHFSSKEKLVEALIEKRIEYYHSAYEEIEKLYASQGVKEKFISIIKYLVDDCSKRESCVFFTQMWAMSFIKKEYKYFIKLMYDYHIEYLKTEIKKVYPTLSDDEIADKAMAASCMIEGSLVHFGYGIRSLEETEKYKENLCRQLLKLFDFE